MNVNYISLIIFIIISICNIYFVKVGNKKGIYITKPLLIPMLIIFYVLSTENINWLIVSALVFGCLGDILLMLPRGMFVGEIFPSLIGHILIPMLIIFYVLSTENINGLKVSILVFGFIGGTLLMLPRNPFIGGLISFLIGHIFYIVAFINPIINYSILYLLFIISIPYIIGNIIILRSVLPYKKLKNIMKIFGVIYTIVISFMGFSSTLRIFYIQGFKFFATFLGSMLFIISDFLIAFGNLKYKSKNSGVLIMSTYILGQFLIVYGFI
jgi:uncharacterized membrane protein YhhN